MCHQHQDNVVMDTVQNIQCLQKRNSLILACFACASWLTKFEICISEYFAMAKYGILK